MRESQSKKFKRRLCCMITVATIAVSLAACGNDKENKAQTKSVNTGKTTLVVSNGPGDVPTLVPGLVSDTSSLRIVNDLFEGLVAESQSNQPIPGLAKSWDVSKDGLVYTFHLRDHLMWSNGEPLKADDFVYSMKYEVDPKNGMNSAANYYSILNGKAIVDGKMPADSLGVSAPDDQTLVIRLEHPDAFFLLGSAGSYLPVYRSAVEKWGNGWAQVGRMVNNGPYILKEWVPQGYVLLEKNPYYWNAKNVKIQKVKFVAADLQAEYNQFQAGQIDFTSGVPTGITKAQFQKRFGDDFYNVRMLGVYYYLFNLKQPGIDRLDVRKALTMVVNRKLITEQILRMGQTPAYSIVPDDMQEGLYKDFYKQVPGYEWVDWSMEKRISEARKLMAKAGYTADHPLRFTLSFNTAESHKQVAEAIMQMWRQAFGDAIEVNLNNEEWKVYLQNLQQKNYQVARMGGIAGINTPQTFLYDYTCGYVNNNTGFCSKQVDQYFFAGLASPDVATYNQNMEEAVKLVMEDYPVLPIYNYTYSRLVNDVVSGYHPQNNHLDHVYSKWLALASQN
ncbi:MAG: peptide ABC transporter substrate-binding protein [Francisellaceae bacterium]